MVHCSSVNLNDANPSAKAITRNVRIVLWGIVEMVAIRKVESSDCNNIVSVKDSGGFLDTETLIPASGKANGGSSDLSQANGVGAIEEVGQDHERGILQALAASDSQDNCEYMDSYESEDIDIDIDIHDQLPLAFGSSKQILMKKKRKTAEAKELCTGSNKNQGKWVDDDEYLCPEGYIWRVNLPAPPKFVESNLYAVAGAKLVGKPLIIRVLGCGPGLRDSGKPSRSSSAYQNTALKRSARATCMVELLGYDITAEREVFEVSRSDLIELSSSQVLIAMSMLGHTWLSKQYKSPKYEDVHAKYWDQRYRLFSRFDKGVRMDAESWYSVTPESIAQHIAQHCLRALAGTRNISRKALKKAKKIALYIEREQAKLSMHNGSVDMDTDVCKTAVSEGKGEQEMKVKVRAKVGLMLDLFCGSGGNTIPLAAVCEAVIAVDLIEDRLQDARVNAKVYGVEDRIDFVCADAYDILNSLIPPCEPDGAPGVSKVDAVLLAPPWGGPEYSAYDHFDMSTGFPSGDGLELIKLAYKVSKNVICVFPKNIMKEQVHALMEELGAKCRVEEICMYNKHKLSVLYFGHLC